MRTGQPSKRQGKKLKPGDIDDNKKVQDHLRAESRKDHLNRIVIIAYYGSLVAIPLIYVGYLYSVRSSQDEVSKALWSALTAVIGFALGNFLQKENSDD